ncbi:MAG: HAD-IIA family hydrolase [Clostridiales bacterium]|nr:HAD-IIA family hydrolase [Clostridiales bacterium]
MHPNRLSDIKGFILDMDGTFYLGGRLLPASLRFMDCLARRGLDYLFLTNNSSRDRLYYTEKLRNMGFDAPAKKILTSGEAAARYLHGMQPGARLFVVGTPFLERELQGFGFDLVQDTPDFAVLGFDTTLTYEKLWKLCDFVRLGVPYIATHPDFNCPTDTVTGFMPDIGAMIAFVEAATGCLPTVIGKPQREILDIAMQKMRLEPSQLAIVGDRLYTDIAAGRNGGMLSVLVLSGETKLQDIKDSPHKPDLIFDSLGELAGALERL